MEYQPASYGNYIYPKWADAIGWIVGLLPVSIIIISGIIQITQAPKDLSFTQKLKMLIQPTAEWNLLSRPGGHRKGSRNSCTNITKTTLLINGVPMDGFSCDDAMQLYECPSSSKISQNSDGGGTSDEANLFLLSTKNVILIEVIYFSSTKSMF